MAEFAPRVLGRSGLRVGPLGLAGGYGAPARAFEEAFERGCNYFYWCGRKPGMLGAIRNLIGAGKRDQMVIAIQSYTRWPWYLERSVRSALRALGQERVEVLLLGWYNRPPGRAILERARRLQERGLVGHLGMTGHNRPLFPKMAGLGVFDLFQIRYNAAHRGAETEAFPLLAGPDDQRPGITTYTATRWGRLLDPRRMPPGEAPLTASDCYRFVLSHPAVDLCLAGPRDLGQMRQALETLDRGPLTPEEMDRARRIGDHVHG